jgi:hypothetical protein
MSTISHKDPDFIVFFVSSIVYALIGTFGNTVIILVYVSKRRVLSQQTNVLALAVADVTICLFVMPYRILYELKVIENDVICRGMETISHITITFSNVVLCLVCVERFVRVWKPAKIISERLTLFWILIAVGLSVIISVPVPLMAMVIPDRTANSPQFCQLSSRTVGKLGITIYTVMLVLINVVYLGVLIILYSLIYVRLYQNKKKLANHYKMDAVGTRNLKVKPATTTTGTSQPQEKHLQPRGGHSWDIALNSKHASKNQETAVEDLKGRENDGKTGTAPESSRGSKHQTKRLTSVNTKTSTMLFICTFIYAITWITYFVSMFLSSSSLSLRYLYFFSHASNPIVYGIVNDKIRKSTKQLFCRKNVLN